MMQLITIILLPLTLILLVITFGSITVHQNAMRSMVGERDARLVSTAARALGAQIDLRVKELTGLVLMLPSDPSESVSAYFSKSGFLLTDFDAGLAIFDAQGMLLTSQGASQLWEPGADSATWSTVFSELMAQPGTLKVINSPDNRSFIGLISSPSGSNRFIVGAFSITRLAEDSLVEILPAGNQLSVRLVDSDKHILYSAGDFQELSSDHPGITAALQGHSGTVYVNVSGDEHVTAYSPVPTVGWALITEESWETVATPTLRTTQVAPLVLVPGLLIMLLALWLGTRQIVEPLRILESKAATLASGDFNSIQEPVGGIAEIQHLQKELIEMAHKVQDAQRSLHRYIGAITAAQEDERHRLARELHDDTLQALIALQQRVQLAQLELQSSTEQDMPGSTKLQEIASLTGQTIENLRRLTRALRPIYLEDLGLVPALEMLARETGQVMSMTVEFHQHGIEKRLDPTIELALYRMAQELLSNIARHAQANHATLNISFMDASVTLQVEDDGVGFNIPENPSEYGPNGHYGLLGLYERAELIGAALQIRSSPGKGTTMSITLPVKSPISN